MNQDFNLVKFVEHFEYLTDIRNLDKYNPVGIRIQQPLSGQEFLIFGSWLEPRQPLLPLKGIWIDLNPASANYRTVYQLMSFLPNVLTPDFMYTWREVYTYEDIFTYPQDYSLLFGLDGPMGPAGLTGPAGPQGIAGNIGPQGAQGSIGPQGIQGTIGIQGTRGDPGPQGVKGPIGLTGPEGIQGPQGLAGPEGLTGRGTQGPKGDTGLQGPAGTQGPAGPRGADGSLPKVVSSIEVLGPITVNEQTTASYATTVYYNDGSSDVLAGTATPWSVTNGTINTAGTFTAPSISTSTTVTISATFSYDGLTFNDSLIVTVIADLAVVSMTITGPSSVSKTIATTLYSYTVTYNDGSVVTYSLAHGTIAWVPWNINNNISFTTNGVLSLNPASTVGAFSCTVKDSATGISVTKMVSVTN